ncbi:MAG: site-specific DNA-methyltransferase [Candidatus Binatia bacterium]
MTKIQNRLYYGDNLKIMQAMPIACVDLIYLDPPFKSDQNYNLVYKTMTGKPVPEQAQAFCDTWEMDAEKEKLAQAMPVLMREKGVDEYYVQFWALWMKALRTTQPHLMAYLIYMVERLIWMKTLLRPTGSLYLHCDPTASHYIKVMLDGIFGHGNFRNEIIWKRSSAHNSAKRYGPVHDVVFFYTKGDKYTWNKQFQPYEDTYMEAFYTHCDDDGRRWRRSDLTGNGTRDGESGQPWRGVDVTGKGRHWAAPKFPDGVAESRGMSTQQKLDALDAAGFIHWPAKKDGIPMFKRYADTMPGVALQDIWTDVKPLHNLAKERLGYPTQKPPELLKRIILSSTKKGDVVFDPFCGCGTTIYAAQETDRQWIGCDIAILAVKLIREVLGERYRLAEGKHFTVEGIPAGFEQAELLFKHDPFQFQHWAVEKLGGFPTQKKGADQGIDGKLYFETRDGLKAMVLSVKGGKLRPTDVRDLRGVLEREDECEMAGFISLQEPSKAMQEEAARAGMYEYAGRSYPRIQMLTIRQVFEDKAEFKTPSKVGSRISTGQMPLDTLGL